MKTVKLNMEKALQISQIITKLLSFNNIERKKVYWLSRNREKLQPIVGEGFKKASEVAMRFNVEIPNEGFVPVVKYQAFKKELMAIVTSLEMSMTEMELVKSVFEKYEVKPAVKSGVPVERREEYQKVLKDELGAMGEREYEYAEIIADRTFDQVLQKLTGEEMATIEFMLEEPPAISVASTVLM